MINDISQFSYNQIYSDIEQDIEKISLMAEFVNNINTGKEILNSVEIIKYNMEKFKLIHSLRNQYIQYLNTMEDNIGLLKNDKDISPKKVEEIGLLRIDFDMAVDVLEKSLYSYFKNRNITDIVVKEKGEEYSVSCKTKGISPEILKEATNETNKTVKIFSDIEVIEIEEDSEYSYKIQARSSTGKIEQAVGKIKRFIDEIFIVIKKYQVHREDLYFAFYNSLTAQYNEVAEEKSYQLNNFVPFKWQQEAFEVWQQKENNYHGTFSVCTGAGKTYFALYSIQQLVESGYDLRVSIVVPSKAIMQQWYNILIERFHVGPNEIGRKGDGHKSLWNDKKFIIYISNTAQKQIASDTLALEEFRKIKEENFYHYYLMDECHHYATDNSLQMLDGLTELGFRDNGVDYFAMGLSATPDRTDKKEDNLYYAIGQVIYEYNILEALADSIVSPFTIHNIDCRLTKEEKKILDKINKAYSMAESKFGQQLLEYKGKMENSIHEIKEYSSDSLLQIAYGLAGGNRKKLDAIYSKQNDFKEKYENKWKEPFEEWLEGRNDDKLIYSANRVVTIHDKKVKFIQSSDERTETCLDYCKRNKDRKVIVFCEYIDSADEIYEQLVDKFGKHKVKRYYSLTKDQLENKRLAKYERDKENREALEAFIRGNTNIIVTVKSFNEGIDIPNADIAIVYQSKVSKRESIQRLGRIVRKNRSQDATTNEKKPILYFLYAKEQKEPIFLQDYFENPGIVSNKGYITNDKIKKYKRGLDKISFYPPNQYNLSNYIVRHIENQESGNENNDTTWYNNIRNS